MTRQQAQSYAFIPRDKLAQIHKGFDVHYDALLAFARGEEIECKNRMTGQWTHIENPEFFQAYEYRIRKQEKPCIDGIELSFLEKSVIRALREIIRCSSRDEIFPKNTL